jgi:glycosyltransferase involved in cell wall biosynthesis
MSNETLIVLPTYNEAGNIGRLIADLRRADPLTHLLVIDDNSPDGTGRIADEAAATTPGVKVVHRSGKLGLGTAHVLGIDHAIAGGYQTLVTMDCDYTHNPADVPRVIAALAAEQADVAVGSRYAHQDGVPDWPLWRKVVTRTAHVCTKYMLGIPADATSAFRAYRVSSLARVPYREIKGDGYSFIFELLFSCMMADLVVAEVPCQFPIRQAGKSKISRIEVLRAIKALGRLSATRAAVQLKKLTRASAV